MKPIVFMASLTLTLLSINALAVETNSAAINACSSQNESCETKCAATDLADNACKDACRSSLNQCVADAKASCTEGCESQSAATPTRSDSVSDVAPEVVKDTATNSNADAPAATSTDTAVPESPAPPEAIQPVAEPKVAAPLEAPAVAKGPAEAVKEKSENTTASLDDSKPKVSALTTKRAAVQEQELNKELLIAVRDGNLKAIRSLIQTRGLNPTYVYSHDFDPTTRLYEGKIVRLRLNEILTDTSTLRNEAVGLDKVLSLFLELGLDTQATLTVAGRGERTAWGPSLAAMYKSRDRDARVRAFEVALKAGLRPNDDIGEWIFTEFPQACGQDRSKFAIQIVDLLVQYLGTTLQPHFRRPGDREPETLADVLSRSYSQTVGKTAYEKNQAALQDDRWEQCSPLARRVARYLTQGT